MRLRTWRPGRLTIAAAIGVPLFALWLLLHVGGDQVTSAVDGLGLAVASGGAAVLSAIRAHTEARRAARLGWACLSVSCATFLLAEAVSAYLVVGGGPTGFPSATDAFYLVGAAAGVGAVLMLPDWSWIGRRAVVLLDGGIVAGAILQLSWLVVLRSAYLHGHGGAVGFSVELTYALADVVTMVIVVSWLAHTRRVDRPLAIVALAMLCFAVSDTIFIYVQSQTRYESSSPLDAGWLAGYALVAVASRAHGLWGPERPGDEVSRWQLLVPYVPLALSIAIVLANVAGRRTLDAFSQVLLSIVVALVLLRQLLAMLEAQSLAARLRTTAAEQRVLIEQAPVGICRLDDLGRIQSANGALEAMIGRRQSDLQGRALRDLVDPADRSLWGRAATASQHGGPAQAMEVRMMRADSATLWCSATVGPLEGSSWRGERSVAIIEDISERRGQTARAAQVQRQLLPEAPPQLEGYEIAGACRPAADVAGDFYDWLRSDDYLDVTVADVMGKGIASALVMAVLHTALRFAPETHGPAARVRQAAGALGLGMTGEGLFVTLFHARLHLGTGRLRYVDAGHGYCAIRRPDGRIVRLPGRSLPVGVLPDAAFEEGTALIEPGDQLVVYSDGLVEREDRTLDLDDFAGEFERSNGPSDVVACLMDRMPAHPTDDVTVVVLARRLAAGAPAARTRRAVLSARAGG
jgi:PAS domain S-box-containing protein